MEYPRFLKNKIERQILMNGQTYAFRKIEKDKFGQTKISDDKVSIEGMFHQTSSFVKSQDGDGARMVSKPQPMILTLYEDGLKIEKDYLVEISGQAYKVVDKTNVNNLNVAFEISLEVEK